MLQVTDESSTGEGYFSLDTSSANGLIKSDLSVGADITSTKALKAMKDISQRGFELGNSGFILMPDDNNDLYNGNSVVIRPYANGRDLMQKSRNAMVIDLHGYSEEEVKIKFPSVYQWLLERVKPERENNRDKKLRDQWWLHRRARTDLRSALLGISRYIATVETSKHRVFTFLEEDILPDNMLVNIATDKASHLGVLSSRVHAAWVEANGGTLGASPRYNKRVCFENFPFPVIDENKESSLEKLALEIDELRKNQQSIYPDLTLTDAYNVLEKLRREEPLTAKDKKTNQQGLVSVLKEMHDNLDREVFSAYGWNDLAEKLVGLPGATAPFLKKSEEQTVAEDELLSRLVDLNHARAKEEAEGTVRWLREDYQSPDSKKVEENKNSEKAKVRKEKAPSGNKTTKISWPKELHEQINIVLEVLSKPLTTVQLADQFKRKPIAQIESVITALSALGKVNESDGGVWELI